MFNDEILAKSQEEREALEVFLRSENTGLQILLAGFTHAHIGIFFIDENYKIQFQNRIMQDWFGPINGKSCYALYQNFKDPCKNCPSNFLNRTEERAKYQFIAMDGRSYEVLSVPFQNFEGKVENSIQFVLDITEQKQAKHKLYETEKQLSNAFDNAAVGMVLISPEYKFLKANKSFVSMIGYSREQLQHMTFQDITHPEDYQIGADIGRKLLKGDAKTGIIEKRYIHKKGYLINVRLTIALIRDEKGKPLHFFTQVEDITERIKTQEQLIQSEKLISIGLLAAGIAHEINNPLMGVRNYAQIIKEELETIDQIDLSVKPFSFLNNLIKETIRISDIVDGLLTFARKDKGEFEFVTISEVIHSSLSLLLTILKDSQIEIQLSFTENVPALPMKPQNIQQVILNILQNSIDAIQEKCHLMNRNWVKSISIKTSVVRREKKDYCKIMIKDNGQGINKELLKKIVDPFFTTKPISNERRVGLGLSISYGIIKDHRGIISIRSKWKESTNVEILLPINR